MKRGRYLYFTFHNKRCSLQVPYSREHEKYVVTEQKQGLMQEITTTYKFERGLPLKRKELGDTVVNGVYLSEKFPGNFKDKDTK